MRSLHRNINKLELLLISHPGEFGLISGDRSGKAQRHDYDSQVEVMGEVEQGIHSVEGIRLLIER